MNTAKTERNKRIFEAVLKGETWEKVARIEGISKERGRQIVVKMVRTIQRSIRSNGISDIPECNSVYDLRDQASSWINQLNKQ